MRVPSNITLQFCVTIIFESLNDSIKEVVKMEKYIYDDLFLVNVCLNLNVLRASLSQT